MAKAAYTAQFVPWTPQELVALDVPLNRAFRRLLQLPSSNPNALLYMSAKNGGLGLPRLSDQVNATKWAMSNRLQQRGGLPALAVNGLLTRASELSGGQFLLPTLGDFIGLGEQPRGHGTGVTPSPHAWPRPPPTTPPPYSGSSPAGQLHPSPNPPSSWPPHMGGPHLPSPRWDPILARPSRAPFRPLTPLLPAGPPTLARRTGSNTPRAVLAPEERIGGLGMGWHSPGSHLPPGTERTHFAMLGSPAHV